MKPAFKYFIVFLLLAALAPYLIICFYAFPFADDFCFGWTASQNISFLQKILNQYLYWNGRYTADVLVNLHPLVSGKIINYQLSILVSLLATPLILWAFFRALISDNLTAFILSLFVTLFYLNYQPNITEGIYWFVGISNYHLGNLLFILQLTFMVKAFSEKGNHKIIFHFFSFLLLIVSVGFNEVGALLFPCFYLVVTICNFKSEGFNRNVCFAYSFIAIIASAFVFFAPGNFIRGNEFADRYNLFHSLLYSSFQTIRFLGKWMLNGPFLLLTAIVVANIDKVRNQIALPDFRLLFAGLLLVVFAGAFLPYFATGMLGQHRTINFVFFFFILLWLSFLLSASEKFDLSEKLKLLTNEKVVSGLLITSIFLMMISGNGIKIIYDFKSDNFSRYATVFFERQKVVVQNSYLPLKKLGVVPSTFDIVDARSDTTWWVDKCMRKYYEKNEIRP